MLGHNGGVTGVQMQLNIAATSSYDATVCQTCHYFIFVIIFQNGKVSSARGLGCGIDRIDISNQPYQVSIIVGENF